MGAQAIEAFLSHPAVHENVATVTPLVIAAAPPPRRRCLPCPVAPRPSAPHVLLAAAVSPPSSLRVISALYSAYSIWRFVRFAAIVAASDQRRAHPVERLRAPARLLIVLSLLDTNVLLSPSNRVRYNSDGVAHSPP
jgi:hypothetical protein